MANPISYKRIILNAGSAALQVIVVGVMYFMLYRYLLKTLGPSQLGVWALVLSTSSIANLANFGITSGLVKFVADYKAQDKSEHMHKLIFTAFLSIVAFFLVLILIAYLVVGFIITKIIDKQYVALALRLLPYSLLCLFINEMGSVYTSILEGFQKNYLRNIIYISASIIFLLLAYLFVPRYGLMGVTYAQVIQSVLILITAFISGASLIKNFTLFRWNWDKVIFKQLISYGSKFQLISILQMLYEPATKTLLTKFGGLPAVGYYEMATRLVNQIRALIVNANQIMIPVVAQASHNGIGEVKKLYAKTMSVTLLVNAPLITGVIAFSYFISVFWIGHLEQHFIFPLIVLSITIFFNAMCGPAYYSSLGQGKLNLLVYVHIFMAVLNITLGVLLGYFFHGDGVIISWGITLSVGSLLLIIFYQRNHQLIFSTVFSKADLLLLFISVSFSAAAIFFNKEVVKYFSISNLALYLIVFLIVFVPLALSNANFKALLHKRASLK